MPRGSKQQTVTGSLNNLNLEVSVTTNARFCPSWLLVYWIFQVILVHLYSVSH